MLNLRDIIFDNTYSVRRNLLKKEQVLRYVKPKFALSNFEFHLIYKPEMAVISFGDWGVSNWKLLVMVFEMQNGFIQPLLKMKQT